MWWAKEWEDDISATTTSWELVEEAFWFIFALIPGKVFRENNYMVFVYINWNNNYMYL